MPSNLGDNAKELERKAQKHLSNKHVRASASCDIALILGISALSLLKGSRCIATPFAFNFTVDAIIWN